MLCGGSSTMHLNAILLLPPLRRWIEIASDDLAQEAPAALALSVVSARRTLLSQHHLPHYLLDLPPHPLSILRLLTYPPEGQAHQ